MMNIDRARREKANLLINVRNCAEDAHSIFDFPVFEEASNNTQLGPDDLLFINGGQSM